MKKNLLFLAVLTLLLALTATALAADVSASYNKGKLTVSTTSSGWFTISVDGVGTGRSLTPKVPSLTFEYELANGFHRVSISSMTAGSGSTTFEVTDGKETPTPSYKPVWTPTPDPSATKDPKATATPKPTPVPADHDHVPVEIPAVEPTCTKKGQTSGLKCALCGEILMQQQSIPALNHSYRVENKSKTNVTYSCVRCGSVLKASLNEPIANRFSNIITNLKDEVLSYQAYPAKNEEKTIVLKLDKETNAAVLTMENSLIAQIIREGYEKVQITKGAFDAVVELNKISRSWFSAKGAIEAYVFTLVPNGGCKVEAKIAGDLVAADTFDGVTVK